MQTWLKIQIRWTEQNFHLNLAAAKARDLSRIDVFKQAIQLTFQLSYR